MSFSSRDFLNPRGVSEITYGGTWNRSSVWFLGPLFLRLQPNFAWKEFRIGLIKQRCSNCSQKLARFMGQTDIGQGA